MVLLKDIARKAGVSISTVSFVLNGKDKEMRISTGMAKKIKEVALQEGYQPNQVAVSLRTGKSKIIGLLVDTISGSFFASLALIIEREAETFGYKVIYCSTGNEIKKGKELIRILHQSQVDGYIIIPTEGMENGIKELLSEKKPVVLMDSYFTGTPAPYVLVNNFSGTASGISHLIKKGYKKIGFVCNDLQLVQMHDRKRAYIDTLAANNIRLKKQWIVETKYKSPKEEVIKHITSFIQSVKPDAIMFAANYLGVYGLESIRNLNLTIPDNIAVVCFDDHELFNLYPPGITSIRQPVEDIAKTAVHILMDEINGHKKVKQQQVQLEARMIERNST